jgi:hypothetical protein
MFPANEHGTLPLICAKNAQAGMKKIIIEASFMPSAMRKKIINIPSCKQITAILVIYQDIK